MVFVGPVETGNYQLLPDFGETAKGFADVRILLLAESMTSCPQSSQSVDNRYPLSKNRPTLSQLSGMNACPMLVDGFIPWFMPCGIHSSER